MTFGGIRKTVCRKVTARRCIYFVAQIVVLDNGDRRLQLLLQNRVPGEEALQAQAIFNCFRDSDRLRGFYGGKIDYVTD